MKHVSCMLRLSALLVAALLLFIPITASAAESAPMTEAGTEASAPAESGTTATGEGAAPREEESLPVSAAFVDFLEENAAGLLAGASFLLTLFVSLLFKKKLVPSLLEALSGLLGKGRAALDTITDRQSAEGARIDALFSEIGALLSDAHDAAVRAEEAAELIKEREGSSEEVRAVLLAEAELLFSLLTSANLPQYEKDRVAAVYARIADRVGTAHE